MFAHPFSATLLLQARSVISLVRHVAEIFGGVAVTVSLSVAQRLETLDAAIWHNLTELHQNNTAESNRTIRIRKESLD